MVDALLAKTRKYLPQDRIDIISDAYRFAEKAHRGQSRLSGEPFIDHPIQTAMFLANLRLDSAALAAALLHDVIEDCGISYEELEKEFGPEVAKLVDGVTKLTQTEMMLDGSSNGVVISEDKGLAKAESLQKMLMSMGEDVRIVLIKLSDRLHNMRTLKALPADRRVVIAQETLDIYAPLAHRLGIWEVKWRLEDLALRYLNPESFRSISKLLRSKRAEREEYVQRVRDILKAELDEAGIDATVTGRPKHIYSIHEKIKRYASENREVGEIYDLFALRVLVDDVKDCYAVLGVVHTKWHPIPGQFDDYVANPKDNLYQSLHTTVLCEDASPVEVQIRTGEMHRVSEYGVAAHWLYKEGNRQDVRFEEKMAWLRQLLEWQRDVSGAQEFVESFKSDIFNNQVFVYTPKGDIKDLPAGATPVDFAFRIHTDIGLRCIGAKVNDKLVPLHHRLQSGDTIKILTSETVRGPSPDWLNPNLGYVNTSSARAKIRLWFNRQERQINVERGRETFENQVRRLNMSIDDVEVAEMMGYKTTDEFFTALGSGILTAAEVVNRVSQRTAIPEQEQPLPSPKVGPASGVEVLGVGDLLPRMARCCQPIHGDEIIGYITGGMEVTVHQKACSNVPAEAGTEELVPVRWGETRTLYPVRIQVKAWDRVGLLRDVTSLVSEERVNIAACVSEEYEDISIITLTVFVSGIYLLNRLFSRLEGVSGVIGVARAES